MAEGEAPLVEADPRTRGNFAYRSGERGNFKTDGMDSRPLIHGLAMGPGCVEQHPNKARSDCHKSQLVREWLRGCPQGPQALGSIEASRLWTCGQPASGAVQAGHGGLHGVFVLMMAFSISSKRRMVATIATLFFVPTVFSIIHGRGSARVHSRETSHA